MSDEKPCPDRQAALAPRDPAINACRETKAAMLADVERHADAMEGLLSRAILDRDEARTERDGVLDKFGTEVMKRGKAEQRLAALRKGTAATVRKLREAREELAKARKANVIENEVKQDTIDLLRKRWLKVIAQRDAFDIKLEDASDELDTLRKELIEARASRSWWDRVWGWLRGE